MVCAQIEFGRGADHPIGSAAVRRSGGDREIPWQNSAWQRHHYQIPDGEVRCPADDVAGLGFAHVDLDRADGLLELGEILDLGDAADGQWAADRPDRDDFLDLVADPDQRLFQLVG